MNDDLDTLEAEFKALRPTPLSPELRDRILSQLNPESAELAELEQELAALMPTKPSTSLQENIAADLRTAKKRKKPPVWPIIALAAVAILAVVLILPKSPTDAKPQHAVQPKPEAIAPTPQIAQSEVQSEPAEPPTSTPLAFSDPRAQAMVAAGYRPVSLEQMVLDTHDLGPDPEHHDARQVRVKVLQAIKWDNQRTGVRVDTKQIHEAIIRRDASFH